MIWKAAKKVRESLIILPKEMKRYQTFAAILFTYNNLSLQEFGLPFKKKELWGTLSSWWGIENAKEAKMTAQSLAMADRHTPFADEMFTLIKENEEKLLAALEEDYVASDSDEISIDLARLENTLRYSAETVSQYDTEHLTDDEYYALVEEYLLSRLGTGLSCYASAKKMLIELGYTEEALSAIKTVAAWDYGRCGLVARYSTSAWYMEENEAWKFIKTAAENATQVYSSWFEYTAAYILGRAIAFEEDSSEFYPTLKFLLSDEESPYYDVPFKGSEVEAYRGKFTSR